MTNNLLESFAAAVELHGDRTALIESDGHRVTFDALMARAGAMAEHWIARGLRKSDRILIAMPLSADLYAALAALWSVGAVAVLPEPAMGLKGVRDAVKLSGVKGLCATGGYTWLRWFLPGLWGKPLYRIGRNQAGAILESAGPEADDLALISFTSGSTGVPKAIPRTHGYLQAQWQAVRPLLAGEKKEIDLIAFPVFVLINLAEGRCTVLPNWPMSQMNRISASSLHAWIEAQSVTRLLLPPALCEKLAEGNVPSSVTTLITGGGPVFPDIVARLQAQNPDLRIVTVYGSTEAEPIAELDMADVTPEDHDAMRCGKGLLAGRPVSSVKLRIDEGEIVVTGAHVNLGYLDPARDIETKIRDGDVIWHRTGDAGALDAQGRLWLLGRRDAVVSTAKGPLYPFAVETAARLWIGARRAALGQSGGAPVLVVEGEVKALHHWQKAAREFGIETVRHVTSIPLDRRHRSKVDYVALAKLLESD